MICNAWVKIAGDCWINLTFLEKQVTKSEQTLYDVARWFSEVVLKPIFRYCHYRIIRSLPHSVLVNTRMPRTNKAGSWLECFTAKEVFLLMLTCDDKIIITPNPNPAGHPGRIQSTLKESSSRPLQGTKVLLPEQLAVRPSSCHAYCLWVVPTISVGLGGKVSCCHELQANPELLSHTKIILFKIFYLISF